MSLNRHEVVTLGEPLAVLAPNEPVPLAQATTLTLGVGGAEANLAILLSRLGHRVHFISRVGAGDAFNAGFLSAWLRGQSVAKALHQGARLGAATVATAGDYLPQGLADV